MKKSINLFKTLLFVLVTFFVFSAIAACGNKKSKTDGNNPTDNSTITVEMTNSYKTNRANFKSVTGIELPELEKLEVDEYPYSAGDTNYCFDIIGGDNLNYSTYQTFENFFKEKLGNCDEGYPSGDELNGRDAQWTKDGRWYQTYWDKTNKAIYINTTVKESNNSNMTDSYRQGREQFHSIVGIWLPELENIELLPSSDFSTTYQTACFDFKGDKALFDSVLVELKKVITENPLFEDTNGTYWEYIIQVNGKDRKINVDISYDPENPAGTAIYINGIVRNYYSVTLTAETGGSVTLKMGSHLYDNNVASITAGDNLILTAIPDASHSFVGWYIGTELLSTNNPYTYIAEKKDITIQAIFEDETSNMEDDYKAFRNTFNQLVGVLLPTLEGVNTDHEYSEIDNENHVRDEVGGELLFTSSTLAIESYSEIKTLLISVMGNPEESFDNEYMLMDQWSIPYYETTIPYRVEAMMTTQPEGTTINLMWRKQPIVIINVSSDGPGVATGVYINSDYEEVPYTKYFEIVDAFHGILVATPNTGMEFVGWYVNDELVSTDARYLFSYNNVTFTEITFVGKFTEPVPVEMTDSYSQARTSLQAVSGLLLPELPTVTGMFEDLGSDMFMLDIGSATEDTLTAVIAAFDAQTNTTSSLDLYGKNVYNYTREVNSVTYDCELSCFYDSGLVVIMYQEILPAQMTDSYNVACNIFKSAIGIDLPAISDLETDIAFGEGYVMLDIVSGTNLTKTTYDSIIEFLDGLTDWTGQDDTQSAEYPTKKYTNSTSSMMFQVVWNGESDCGGIYLNAFNTALLSSFNGYNEAKNYLAIRYDITLPTISNLIVDFSAAADSSYMTFDMSEEYNFTETEYNQFVSALSEKLGNGTNADDEYQKRTTWIVEGLLWDVIWDLTTGIAINFGPTN